MSIALPLQILNDSETYKVYGCELVGAGPWAERQLQALMQGQPSQPVQVMMSPRKDPIAQWALNEFKQKFAIEVIEIPFVQELEWALLQIQSLQIPDPQQKLVQRFTELFTRQEWLWRRALAQAISESSWHRLSYARLQAVLKIQSMDFGLAKAATGSGLDVNPSLQWFASAAGAQDGGKKIYFMGLHWRDQQIFEVEGEPWMAELIDFIEDHRDAELKVVEDSRIQQARQLGLII